MAHKTEQIDYQGTRPSWRKWKRFIKRQTVRAMRRIGKKLLEDAPKRVTGGWTS